MCGIVGYVGHQEVQDILLSGLEKLEYRGYDSAGISIQNDGQLDVIRAVGNLSQLKAAVEQREADGGVAVLVTPATTGIGHTRWATHGRVTEENAHPHYDPEDRVHVVVNGIVENYMELKQELLDSGAAFSSETDVEVIAHLIARDLEEHGLVESTRRTYNRLRGHYSFVAVAAEEPGVLVGARKECPLIVGRGDGEQFLASGIPAFLAHSRTVQALEDDELVVLTADGARFLHADGTPFERDTYQVDWDADAAEKGGFETFMLKEIHEQADAVADTIADRTVRPDGVDLPELDDELLRGATRLIIVACGTSYHAGLIGRYALEEWARIPVEMDVASEYRYRNPVVGPGDIVIGITQSGETLDTLAAMRLARERGATVIAVTNIMGSQATRDAHSTVYTRAGLEIGVAATKTFVAQVAVMYLLALRMAELRGTLTPERRTELVTRLKRIPHDIGVMLDKGSETIDRVAERHFEKEFFLYLGRHVGLPVSLEGALKLKEISYIATDAYAAGEMKHGPIALLDQDTPVVVVATDSPVLEKVISNIQEVKVRGAHVIAVATEGTDLGDNAEDTLRVPPTDWMLQPLLAVIPLQLLAYRIARLRGLNVDQPRNLAKTVTVE
ncbi:glutamine--fructose-6-phosphate transaminase (isomerizing) [Solirubrobacter ginsenosidimutans]|uniref:Glutamine--fructose-6-phosphate aminotransferase [isomerizing] n=1 Tax=Solirubrobacter ginsenosidimutans TaxID=490573 RepID=A0A9X3N163_9ACTN|nr:glutamine--fructose-6-phosphate transaminase (isomerizing) [Solirubrobacter ginsenosidimutans]MDA0165431.1 glutamine--fructose-6-phosphate transaminase (isomerizing) [Solirubrobacter ginsenosidimutans]